MHDYIKGLPGGVLPPLSAPLATFRAPGNRRFNPWEGILYHRISDVSTLYEPSDSVGGRVPRLQGGFRALVEKAIFSRQFPEDCKQAKVLVYSFEESYAGFFSFPPSPSITCCACLHPPSPAPQPSCAVRERRRRPVILMLMLMLMARIRSRDSWTSARLQPGVEHGEDACNAKSGQLVVH